MKRKIKLLGLSLVAVLAFSAVAVGSASATNGPIIDPFDPPITFGGVNEEEPQVLETVLGLDGEGNEIIAEVRCTGNVVLGEFTSPETGIAGILFGSGNEDCEAVGIGQCEDVNVENPTPGIITTKVLRTETVWLENESKFGFVFSPNAGPKNALADFKCREVRITVFGSVLGEIEGVEFGVPSVFYLDIDVIEDPEGNKEQEWTEDACGMEYRLKTFLGIPAEETEPERDPATEGFVSRLDSGKVKLGKATFQETELIC